MIFQILQRTSHFTPHKGAEKSYASSHTRYHGENLAALSITAP